MIPRIATLATLMALVGCVTAESHEPSEATLSPLATSLVGRWENAAGEIHDLRAGGVWLHTPATVLRAPGVTTGTWHTTEFGGEQYLVTVAGGTGAQRIVNVTSDAIELQPGGVYDLVTQ